MDAIVDCSSGQRKDSRQHGKCIIFPILLACTSSLAPYLFICFSVPFVSESLPRATEKQYTEVPVKPGDHVIIIKGHNDSAATLNEGLTDVVVFDIINCLLQSHVAEVDMIVKAVTMTDKDTPLSANATKKRWAKAGNKGKPPIIKMRVFAVHIGLADETEVLSSEDDKLIIEILDNIFRRKLHHDLDSTSPWPPLLEQHLAPVKARNPKPIAIIYGLNPATHGADTSTCNDISWTLWAASNLTGVHRAPTFLDWQKQFGVRATNFQGIIRYQVFAADVSLKPIFHKALKSADNKLIKFRFGGLDCVPRMMPDSQTDTMALKNLLIEYVDNVQKQWKPFLMTGMQTGIPPEVITNMANASPLIAAISYKTSYIRDTASAMIYVTDSFATIADTYGEIPECYLTQTAQMTYPQGSGASRDATAPAGRAIGVATKANSPASTRASQDDSTASFREEMGIQDPQRALTMEELLDHEGSVWVVLKQHNRSNNRLLAVFGCPVNAQFYAKTHRGFQKRYDSVTDMFEEGNGRGIIQPLKAAYYAALGNRANATAAPSTPEHRQQGKRTRIRSPGNANP
eukprot:scaffold223622_cov31-Attheya_sp.AAC.2